MVFFLFFLTLNFIIFLELYWLTVVRKEKENVKDP